MSDLIRDAPLGQIIRWATRNKYLRYPEEEPDFECPSCYAKSTTDSGTQSEAPTQSFKEGLKDKEKIDADTVLPAQGLSEALEQIASSNSSVSSSGSSSEARDDLDRLETIRTQQSATAENIGKVSTRQALSNAVTREQLEEQFAISALEKGPSKPVVPTHLDDGTILVDWYTTDDQENPQNWSPKKKGFVALQIYLYTFAVYIGSAIYTPSIEGVVREFDVSIEAASLGLSMYVLAYGLGPMIFSPLSEVPLIGRNIPYMITFSIFVILLIPSSLVQNFAGLIVLRFLQGFFGSPALATGGASLSDLYSLIKIPYVLSLWAFAATCAPALGPIISGFSVVATNWRWSQWEMLWLSGPIWILMFLFLPETSGPTILLRRAQRLRKHSGNDRLKSQSEIDQAGLDLKALAIESLWRPIQIMLLDPAVAFTAIYTSLVYGIYYSFFEAFPIVFFEGYHFNLGETGLTFLSITVGVLISLGAYWTYLYTVSEPEIRKHGLGTPERRLIPALFASFLCPIGLFIFGWTAQPSIHWIVSLVGVAIFTVGIFIVLQCIFLYLPLTYPQYAASLFAGNDFTRSTLAAGAIHFSRPLFINLGVGRGVSLLAALLCGCIGGLFVLYSIGDKLRARSRFTAK